MKKRMLSLVLALILVLSVLPPLSAFAALTSGKCGENLRYSFDKSTGRLTITGTGAMYDRRMFSRFEMEVTSIALPSGLTKIGEENFMYMTKLKSITVPNKVKSIGGWAFNGCTALKTVRFGSRLEEIWGGAFEDCSALQEIDIPEGVTSVRGNAFKNCTSLSSVTIPDTVTVLGDGAFMGCSSLTEITIPPAVKIVESDLLRDCVSLTSVTLPKSIREIDGEAFRNCSSLKSIKIPKKVKSIEFNAFRECTALTSIVIPDGVELISSAAFMDCKNLKKITIPDSVTWYAGSAFEGCEKLQSIDISESVTLISDNCFKNCKSLTEVTVPSSVTKIGETAFYGCENLTKLKILTPKFTITQYFDGAFGDPKITKVYSFSDSTAEKYANRHKYSFTPLKKLPAPKVTVSRDAASGKPSISWKALDGAERYRVYRSDSKYGTYTRVRTTAQLSWIDKDTKVGETWYYKVQGVAADATKNSYYSIVHSACCALPQTTVSASRDPDTGCPIISWEPVEGAAEYLVVRNENLTYPSYRNFKTTTELSVQDKKATAGWYYQYSVIARFASGTYSAADSAKAEPVKTYSKLARPAVTAETDATTGQIVLSWPKNAKSNGFEIYRAASRTGDYTLAAELGNFATWWVDEEAQPGDTFYYKVKAMGGSARANSLFSKIRCVTCDLPCPVASIENDPETGRTVLSWDAVDGAVGYQVYRAEEKDGAYLRIRTTTKLSAADASAEPGQKFYYKVRATAEKTAANSAFSKILARTCHLPRPTVTVSLSSKGYPKLSWQEIPGAVSYKVYRSDAEDGTYLRVITTEKLSTVNTSAEAGHTWYYKVIAVAENTTANSAFSLAQSITVN